MAAVSLNGVTKIFGTTTVIPALDLEIAPGQFMVLVGPSGCGKSTLLRLVAGLEDVSSGSISIGGKLVGDLDPVARGVAMVFQNYALYPHMSVEQNLSFGLKVAGHPRAEVRARVAEAARALDLDSHLKKRPSELSGGQKQRVAMGRAMVRRPQVFLFDEPLSNLDAQLRVRMRAEISLLHRSLGSTVIYVTHDQTEAMTLADRIAVMRGGRIEQVGTPLEIYDSPATQFVASFIGTPPMNILPADVLPSGTAPAGTATVGIRAEAIRRGRDECIWLGAGKVILVELLGAVAHVHLACQGQVVVTETKAPAAPRLGDLVELSAAPSALFFFDAGGRRCDGKTASGAGR